MDTVPTEILTKDEGLSSVFCPLISVLFPTYSLAKGSWDFAPGNLPAPAATVRHLSLPAMHCHGGKSGCCEQGSNTVSEIGGDGFDGRYKVSKEAIDITVEWIEGQPCRKPRVLSKPLDG